jgi:methylase of polypeptide subunit release factors
MENKNWLPRWKEFKESPPYKVLPYLKRNWGSSLHSLCSYQGKLKPAIAHHLVNVFTDEGDTVLDPFSGSGTIAFEAALGKRNAISFDISDMSVAISNAKLQNCSRDAVESIILNLSDYIKSNVVTQATIKDSIDVSFNKSIKEYFEEKTFDEILKSRDYFLETKDLLDPNWCLVFSSMLHILHGNRPYALSRRSHPLTPYAPTGDFERKPVIDHLRTKTYKSFDEKNNIIITEGSCLKTDILGDWDDTLQNVDAIITSPPFVASTKFYMTNWMRFWFAGWGKDDFKKSTENFIEVKQKNDMGLYKIIFDKFAKVLSDDGVVVLHVGKNKTLDMGTALADLATGILKVEDLYIEAVGEMETHGIKDKGGTTEHQYLVLSKP